MSDEIQRIAGQFGFSPKQLRNLERKYGDGLESVLQKWETEAKEKVRIPGAQGGYTTSPFAALRTSEPEDPHRRIEPEAVPEEYQAEITKLSHVRWALYVNEERSQEVADQQGKQLVRKLRRLQVEAAKAGVDITPRLAAMVEEAESALQDHRKAA